MRLCTTNQAVKRFIQCAKQVYANKHALHSRAVRKVVFVFFFLDAGSDGTWTWKKEKEKKTNQRGCSMMKKSDSNTYRWCCILCASVSNALKNVCLCVFVAGRIACTVIARKLAALERVSNWKSADAWALFALMWMRGPACLFVNASWVGCIGDLVYLCFACFVLCLQSAGSKYFDPIWIIEKRYTVH